MQTFPTTTIFQFLPQLKSTENGIKSTSNPHHHNYYYKERNNWNFFHISPLFFSKRIYLLKLNVENLKTPFRRKKILPNQPNFFQHTRTAGPGTLPMCATTCFPTHTRPWPLIVPVILVIVWCTCARTCFSKTR